MKNSNTKLEKHIEAFKTEALMMLRIQLAFDRISRLNDLKNISRSDFVDRLISLKTIENDLTIRICKFDDTTKGVHSFPKAKSELAPDHPYKSAITEKILEFSELISQLKKVRRNTKLAHLQVGSEDNEYEVKYNFTPAIKLIVQIIDLMSCARINYKWSDGQHEKFDLRHDVLKDSFNKTN